MAYASTTGKIVYVFYPCVSTAEFSARLAMLGLIKSARDLGGGDYVPVLWLEKTWVVSPRTQNGKLFTIMEDTC